MRKKHAMLALCPLHKARRELNLGTYQGSDRQWYGVSEWLIKSKFEGFGNVGVETARVI